MNNDDPSLPRSLLRDSIAGLIVSLVALPLCLGIALASGAPLFSGLVAGIAGGIVIGTLSGSSTSVSGPAAGLTTIVAAQIAKLGSFDQFLAAVVLAGVLQIGLGFARAGALSAFFPTSVIKGLLAAIGVILILKQLPHLVGHDSDPSGEMSFRQPDQETTFSELFRLVLPGEIHQGAVVVGLASLAILILWDRIPLLKKALVPAPLVVVLLGVAGSSLLERLGGAWVIGPEHRVNVPVAEDLAGLAGFLRHPDLSAFADPSMYMAAVTLAVVASLETLLNLKAVDKLDPRQRHSPPDRELLAQGTGNIVSGLLGGLPLTSVVIRGSVNVQAGAMTKLSAIIHGILLLVCVGLIPAHLNRIPIASLAAILLVTGFKLTSVKVLRQMWKEGPYQFLPFIVTLVAIVLTDLLVGIVIGLGVSIVFILHSNLRRPLRRILEKHIGGEVLHLEFANQVSFLNRAALERTLHEIPRGGHILLDARRTDYIDPDILSVIREFRNVEAPIRGVRLSLVGFREKYDLRDEIQFIDCSTAELREKLTPARVIRILSEGNERFRSGRRLDRDLGRQLSSEFVEQHPMAVVLGGMHSRAPAELIFDLGLGDIFSVRIAGCVIGEGVLGSVEFATVIAGAKLVLVLGHTGSAMIDMAIRSARTEGNLDEIRRCENLERVVRKLQESIRPGEGNGEELEHEVTRRNVLHSVQEVVARSRAIRRLVDEGSIAIAGAIYDVSTGKIEFLLDDAVGLERRDVEAAAQESAVFSAWRGQRRES